MSRIKISDQDVDNFLNSPEGQAAFRDSGTSFICVFQVKIPMKSKKSLKKLKTLTTSDDPKRLAQSYPLQPLRLMVQIWVSRHSDILLNFQRLTPLKVVKPLS